MNIVNLKIPNKQKPQTKCPPQEICSSLQVINKTKNMLKDCSEKFQHYVFHGVSSVFQISSTETQNLFV